MERLKCTVQAVTNETVELAWVNQSYTSKRADTAPAKHGNALQTVNLLEAKRGFVLLQRRWVVERSFAWATRFRHFVGDHKHPAEILAVLHVVAFARLMMNQAAAFAEDS